ncbi:MAG: hypothetical protein V7754_21990 [Halioglobus sp.]
MIQVQTPNPTLPRYHYQIRYHPTSAGFSLRWRLIKAFPVTRYTRVFAEDGDRGASAHGQPLHQGIETAAAEFIGYFASLTSSLIGTEGAQQLHFHDW